MHAGTDQGFGDLIQLPAYNNVSGLYIVSQAIIVDVLVQRYGMESENKKITTDDKVRVAGILITDPDMRDFIPALTGRVLLEMGIINPLIRAVRERLLDCGYCTKNLSTPK